MGNAIHEAVLQACRNFMIPIARFLLRNGVTYREFAEIAKWAFVHVASEDYGKRNRKASSVRIAEVTDLPRKEVARLRKTAAESVGSHAARPTTQAVRLWRSSTDFCDRSGEPVALYIGEAGSLNLATLLRRIDPSLEPSTVADALVRSRAAKMQGRKIVLSVENLARPLDDVEDVLRFGQRVAWLATTLNYNAVSQDRDKGSKRFESAIQALQVDPLTWTRCKALAVEQARRLLRQLDACMADQHSGSGANTTTRSVGLGIYVFEENA